MDGVYVAMSSFIDATAAEEDLDNLFHSGITSLSHVIVIVSLKVSVVVIQRSMQS